MVDLRNAQKMIMRLRTLQTHRFVHKEPIRDMILLLGRHYELLYNEKHFLQYTVLEQMEELGFLEKLVKTNTLLPCKKLEQDLDLVTYVIRRRWQEQCLMNHKKRRILLKLFFLRWFTRGLKTVPWLADQNSQDQFSIISEHQPFLDQGNGPRSYIITSQVRGEEDFRGSGL
jgi:hypothetical protein